MYEKDELVAQGPPAPFVLHTAMGETAVSLTREYKGEKVSVDCSVNMQVCSSIYLFSTITLQHSSWDTSMMHDKAMPSAVLAECSVVLTDDAASLMHFSRCRAALLQLKDQCCNRLASLYVSSTGHHGITWHWVLPSDARQ